MRALILTLVIFAVGGGVLFLNRPIDPSSSPVKSSEIEAEAVKASSPKVAPTKTSLVAQDASSTGLKTSEHLLSKNCTECHNDKKKKGKFDLAYLGSDVTENNLELWHEAMEQISTSEMPPEDEGDLSPQERQQLAKWFKGKINSYLEKSVKSKPQVGQAKRLTLTEYKNTLRDLLQIENLGTHSPCSSLLEETFTKGFNKLGGDLMLSSYHLNAYIDTARKILDNVILDDKKPVTRSYKFKGRQMTGKWSTEPRGKRSEWVDLIFPRNHEQITDFKSFNHTGLYKITINAQAIDRDYPYKYEEVGIQKSDPLQLEIKLGTESYVVNVADRKQTIVLNKWVTAGSELNLALESDGLKMINNGNFKFNARTVLKYPKLVDGLKRKDFSQPIERAKNKVWKYWRGPRVRVYSIAIEGPFYKSWPPVREQQLIGKNPGKADIAKTLKGFAEKAYRRPLNSGELTGIINYAESVLKEIGLKGAIKEGMAAILSSAPFIFINKRDNSDYSLANKLSYGLWSSTPDKKLIGLADKGVLSAHKEIETQVSRMLKDPKSQSFVDNFPNAWFELNKLGFMPPEPNYNYYFHRKNLMVDMKKEVRHFFKYALEKNISIMEFITADYSFINQDLAHIYDVTGIKGSQLRRHTFKDGRRGGILGMGAVLTLTADPLVTSPIHRGVWLKENILGSHPKPPPADLVIEEPDVRGAKSIREVLAKHTSDASCRSCHAKIDPFGWAFENFDPSGRWRTHYVENIPFKKGKGFREKKMAKVDASAKFSNGSSYKNMGSFKKLLAERENEIVRCFIKKMLTYVNGVEPGVKLSPEIDRLVGLSASKKYRIVDTITAIFQSPILRPKKEMVGK